MKTIFRNQLILSFLLFASVSKAEVIEVEGQAYKLEPVTCNTGAINKAQERADRYLAQVEKLQSQCIVEPDQKFERKEGKLEFKSEKIIVDESIY